MSLGFDSVSGTLTVPMPALSLGFTWDPFVSSMKFYSLVGLLFVGEDALSNRKRPGYWFLALLIDLAGVD